MKLNTWIIIFLITSIVIMAACLVIKQAKENAICEPDQLDVDELGNPIPGSVAVKGRCRMDQMDKDLGMNLVTGPTYWGTKTLDRWGIVDSEKLESLI